MSEPPDPYAAYTHLRVERPSDGVLLLTLDDPERLNATGPDMHLQLSRVFDCPGEIVAVDERFFECRGFFLTAVPSTECPYTVGV